MKISKAMQNEHALFMQKAIDLARQANPLLAITQGPGVKGLP